MMRRLILAAFALSLPLPVLGQGSGEPQFPMFLDTGTGDLKYRSHTYMSIAGPKNPQLLLVPDQGLTGEIFLTRADGSPGWQDMANARNWNTYSLTFVGCGKADPPPSDDLAILSEKTAFGVMQMGVGSSAQIVISQGLGAAYAIKARATVSRAAATAVLIDAWGPPGSQSRPQPTVEEVLSWDENLEDTLFRRWGLGPKPGRFTPDSDLGPEGFEALLARYERDQPPYWASVLTGFDGGVAVTNSEHLEGWSVLLVQGPHRTRDEIRWDDELAAWLSERGVLVERMKLTDLDLPGISSLPMAGRHAEAVLNHFLDWAEAQPVVREAIEKLSAIE